MCCWSWTKCPTKCWYRIIGKDYGIQYDYTWDMTLAVAEALNPNKPILSD